MPRILMVKTIPSTADVISLLKLWGYEKDKIPFQLDEVEVELKTDTDGEDVLYVSLPLEEDFMKKESNMAKARKYKDELRAYIRHELDMFAYILFAKWNDTSENQ